MKIYTLLLLVLMFACKTEKPGIDPVTDNNGELVFQSGFEKGSTVVAKGPDANDIIGVDQTFTNHNDWVTDFDNHPLIGNFSLQFHQGDSTQRQANIVADPVNPANRVLHFWLSKPSQVQANGRIQANVYGNKGMKEFYQSERIFLPEDFNTVKAYPKEIHWLTLAEYWNNITWSQTVPYGFRITLGLGKAAQENNLHFILDAQDCELFADGRQKYTTVWAETNTQVTVPIGQWFTLEYYYKEGGKQDGRYYMAITPQGGKKQVVFDVRNITHNTGDPAPDGVTDFNPLKLYTSKDLVNFVHDNSKTLQVYWDDYKLWVNKRPE